MTLTHHILEPRVCSFVQFAAEFGLIFRNCLWVRFRQVLQGNLLTTNEESPTSKCSF